MAGFGVLITSVIFITIVTGDTLQLVALVGLTALTSAPNPATTICTNVASNWVGFVDNDDKAKHFDTKTNRHLTMRIFKYLLLGVLTIVIPYVTTMILVIITGDRYEGMRLAVTPGLILAQLLFGLTFIKRPWLIKIPTIVLATALAYGLVLVITKTELIKTTFDLYGFWDLAVTNFIAGLIAWELFYHVDSTVNKSTTTVK